MKRLSRILATIFVVLLTPYLFSQNDLAEELKSNLSKSLIAEQAHFKIKEIKVDECGIKVYYQDKKSDRDWMVYLPTNVKDIDKEGVIRYENHVIKYKRSIVKDGRMQFIGTSEAMALNTFKLKKNGIKNVKEGMQTLVQQCIRP